MYRCACMIASSPHLRCLTRRLLAGSHASSYGPSVLRHGGAHRSLEEWSISPTIARSVEMRYYILLVAIYPPSYRMYQDFLGTCPDIDGDDSD